MSITDIARALNHWGAGIAFLGILFSLAPAAAEIGCGISAVGTAYYAAHKRRHPAWGALCVLPFLGALSALTLLAILPPPPETDGPVPARWLRSPHLWAAVLFLLFLAAWMNFNPSAAFHKSKAVKQIGTACPDSGRGPQSLLCVYQNFSLRSK